tara:strand:- start:982 stop:1338 length:357 start_codon:yes stop_codon:yes gene_type:complete
MSKIITQHFATNLTTEIIELEKKLMDTNEDFRTLHALKSKLSDNYQHTKSHCFKSITTIEGKHIARPDSGIAILQKDGEKNATFTFKDWGGLITPVAAETKPRPATFRRTFPKLAIKV